MTMQYQKQRDYDSYTQVKSTLCKNRYTICTETDRDLAMDYGNDM